jgi:hypothetical protein
MRLLPFSLLYVVCALLIISCKDEDEDIVRLIPPERVNYTSDCQIEKEITYRSDNPSNRFTYYFKYLDNLLDRILIEQSGFTEKDTIVLLRNPNQQISYKLTALHNNGRDTNEAYFYNANNLLSKKYLYSGNSIDMIIEYYYKNNTIDSIVVLNSLQKNKTLYELKTETDNQNITKIIEYKSGGIVLYDPITILS